MKEEGIKKKVFPLVLSHLPQSYENPLGTCSSRSFLSGFLLSSVWDLTGRCLSSKFPPAPSHFCFPSLYVSRIYASLESSNNFPYRFFTSFFNLKYKKDGLQSISDLFKNGFTFTVGERHQPFNSDAKDMQIICSAVLSHSSQGLLGRFLRIFVRQCDLHLALKLFLNDKEMNPCFVVQRDQLLSQCTPRGIILDFFWKLNASH